MRNVIYPVIGIALGVLAVWLMSPAFDEYLASRWLVVENVVVTPTAGSPLVTMERRIKRPFTATWTTTIWREGDGGFLSFCNHDGRNDYLPEGVAPAIADLNWWLGIPPREPCPPLVPGRYKVTFSWIISPDGGGAHAVRAESNVFEISLEPAAVRPAAPAAPAR